MIPIEKSAQYFGFYNMLGKFAAIIGPALVGGAGLLARYLLMPDAPSETQLLAVSRMAARWSLSSILILFFLGAGLFYFAGRQKPLTGR